MATDPKLEVQYRENLLLKALARQEELLAENKVLAEENKSVTIENKALAEANHDAQVMVDKLTRVTDKMCRIINQVNRLRAVGITVKHLDNTLPMSTAWCPCCLCGDYVEDAWYLVREFRCGSVHRYGDPSRQWARLCDNLPPALQFGYIPKDGGPRRFVEIGVRFIVPRNAGITLPDGLTVDVNDPDGKRLRQLLGQ